MVVMTIGSGFQLLAEGGRSTCVIADDGDVDSLVDWLRHYYLETGSDARSFGSSSIQCHG